MTDSGFVIGRDNDGTGAVVHLRLAGSFERAAHRELRRALAHELGRYRAVSLVIDVERVSAVGRECVDLLLLGYTKALRGGHGYEIVNAHGPVRQACQAVGLCARRDDDVLYPPAWSEVDDLVPPVPTKIGPAEIGPAEIGPVWVGSVRVGAMWPEQREWAFAGAGD